MNVNADEKIVTGEYSDLAVADAEENSAAVTDPRLPAGREMNVSRAYQIYLLLPAAFLTTALVGGIRIDAAKGAIIFIAPALFCLLAATMLMLLFFRFGLIKIDGWFSYDFSALKNLANAAVIAALFAASTQIFNSLLPERGLLFWIGGFFFFWTLWNALFSEFSIRTLFRSLAATFALAFVSKYIILAALAAPADQSWLRGIVENPVQTAASTLLDLPRFAPATGYLQFFAVGIYLLGLFMTPARTEID